MNEQELIKNFENYLKQRDQLVTLLNQVDGVLTFLKSEIEKLKGGEPNTLKDSEQGHGN